LKKTLAILFGVGIILCIIAVMMAVGLSKELAQRWHRSSAEQNSNAASSQTTEENVSIVAPSSQDKVVGLWGGKWDDQWPIFLSIQASTNAGAYKVRYRWLENFSDEKMSVRLLTGHQTNNYVQASFLIFRMTETNGMLYGDFSTPRMANLVRLDPSERPTPANADELLEKHGWTANAIPADEALKKIKEESGD
jgi:hypothetical protein